MRGSARQISSAARAAVLAVLLGWTTSSAPSLDAQVPYDRLLRADREPANWLTYSGDYRSHRFSRLDHISPENVAGLRPVWVYQTENSMIETTPIVVDGVMFVTEPPSTVTALDARTGRRLWTWSPTMPKDVLFLGFPPTNRGVAILDSTVYVGTLDAHLVALDARSGALRWDVVVADNRIGYAMTLAPLAIDGKVIVGVSGAEAGIRGFIDAYDAQNGDRLWRFWTVPAAGEPGSDTWGGDSWQTGGGSTWLTGSYDPDLGLIYWGIGNPAPDWNGDARLGDNLYTCSLVALHEDTGELAWYFQFTPHDTHDWDANQIPVLVDAEIDARTRRLVVMANRNAFYYVLDRVTGEYLRARPYARQTWAEGLDGRGRPIVLPGTEPTEEGTRVWPSLQGATNWFSPSYSPTTGLFFVAVREMAAVYYKSKAEYQPGAYFLGGGEQAQAGDQASGAIRALGVTTGEAVWDFPLHSPPWAGVLSTAGGLVFGGSEEGNVFALDAMSGEPLWHFQTGGPVRANPISYALDGAQHVAIAAGRGVFAFALP